MDRYGVLVFHDQPLTDDQQMAFSRNFGELEVTFAGEMTKPGERRLANELATSPTSTSATRCARATIARRLYASATGCGTPTRRSARSGDLFPAVGARRPGQRRQHRIRRHARRLRRAGRRNEAEIEDLVCEHSIAFSRAELGFADLAEAHRAKIAPVRHRLVSTHPVTGRKSLYLASHIGGIVGWPVPEARAFIRDLIEHATQPQFVHAHVWRRQRPGDVGQPHHDAPRPALRRHDPGARHAPHDDPRHRHGCRAGASAAEQVAAE